MQPGLRPGQRCLYLETQVDSCGWTGLDGGFSTLNNTLGLDFKSFTEKSKSELSWTVELCYSSGELRTELNGELFQK